MRRGRWRLQRAAFDSDETGRARMNQLVPIGSLRLTHRRIKRGHRGPSRAKFPVFSLVKTLFAAALATSVGNEVLSEFSELGNSVCERRVQCRETRQRLEIDQLSCSAEWLARPVLCFIEAAGTGLPVEQLMPQIAQHLPVPTDYAIRT